MSQPNPDSTDADAVESVGKEEAQLLVNDPDDYHQTRRLRDIHDAKRDVRKTLRDMDRFTTEEEHHRQKIALADAVTSYIIELEEVIETTGWDDSVEPGPFDSLRRYADLMGRDPEEMEITSYEISMLMYREANKALSHAKPLITEEETNEWEI